MQSFDLHHHNPSKNGIYNLRIDQSEQIDAISCFSVAIHPYDIGDHWQKTFTKVKELSLMKNCFAIGECGLDGLISVPDALQEEVFQAHLSWAEEIKKPVIIHCVRRFSQLLKFKKARVPKIIHGFNKKENIATELLNAGFYLSFGKAALYNVSLQKIIEKTPLDRLFLETDNQDFEIDLLYTKVAEIKSLSVESLQKQIEENLDNVRFYG